uniref:Uncharacterized protein n=1 Tax=Acrobeloides nanus TaxID=290746 RepID=A0A914E2Z5_9BILA
MKSNWRIRTKREIVRKSSYELRTRYNDMTPIGLVAKILTKSLLASKNKTEIQPWQYAVERIRDHAIQEKENKKQLKEAQKQFEDYRFRGLRHENIDVDEMIEHPQRLKELLDTKRQDDPKADREQKLLGLVRDGIKLGYSLTGRNTSGLDDKNFKAFSPRLLSVVPEEDDKNLVIFKIDILLFYHPELEA